MEWLQYHDDIANKNEEAERAHNDNNNDSWLNDLATPGRMCADPIRGCIVASGALSRS